MKVAEYSVLKEIEIHISEMGVKFGTMRHHLHYEKQFLDLVMKMKKISISLI